MRGRRGRVENDEFARYRQEGNEDDGLDLDNVVAPHHNPGD